MVGITRRWIVGCALVAITACGAGDTRIDPADLELRDLLGVAPGPAAAWDADQRAAARRVLEPALSATAPPEVRVRGDGSDDASVVRALAAIDASRATAGDGALAVVRLRSATGEWAAAPIVAVSTASTMEHGGDAGEIVIDGSWDADPAWAALPSRGLGVLAALGRDAGHASGPLVVVAAPRLAAIAGYEPDARRLLVNPVLLAALEPEESGGGSEVARAATGSTPVVPVAPAAPTPSTGDNPYSFYGSVAECAAAQRDRCVTCEAAGHCDPVTDATDGIAECNALTVDGGRDSYLLCIDLALEMSAVNRCVADHASSCARVTGAAHSLSSLEENADFLTDATCGAALDSCLADIYGTPGGTFPPYNSDAPLADGANPVATPPRDTAGCSNSQNCSASPSCDCSGPSCNNSLSCSACSSSNDQSGCGDNCDSCSSKSDSGGGGGTCSSGSSSSSSSSSCSSGSGNNCGSCGSGGGDCNSCGSGDSNKCAVAGGDPGPGFAVAISVVWGGLPVPFAAVIRRRSRKKRRDAEASADEEYAP